MKNPSDPSLAVAAYFREFLADKRHRQLLPNVRHLSVRFSIEVLDADSGAWTLELKQGILCDIAVGCQSPECGFRLEAATFLRIASGELSPQFAFFQRRVEIHGRIDLGLRTATVLASFFKTYPFIPAEVRA